MASQAGYGSSMLFQTMNDELSASLATADELSREFNSLLKECAPDTPQTFGEPTQRIQITRASPLPESLEQDGGSGGGGGGGTTGLSAYTPRPTSDGSALSDSSIAPHGQRLSSSSSYGQLTPPNLSPHTPRRRVETSASASASTSGHLSSPNQSPHTPRRQMNQSAFSSSSFGQLTPPNLSPRPQRRGMGFDRSSLGSQSFSPVSNPGTPTYDQSTGKSLLQPPSMEPSHSGRQSPRRSPSPQPFGQPAASTLPRNFMPFRQPEESAQRPKAHANWNESDLDVSYERKPHHSYDKSEWLRSSLPKRNWTESNLDGPPPASRKDSASRQLRSHHSSLPRNTHASIASDQPIISRISIPPTTPMVRQHRPIPLSVIMRLQNPYARMNFPRVSGPEMDPAFFFQHIPPRALQPQQSPADFHQRPYYGEELKPYDLDSELEHLDPMLGGPHFMQDAAGAAVFPPGPQDPEAFGSGMGGPRDPLGAPALAPPRPLSPTRLQPVLAPQAQSQPVPALEELLRIRAEIPRALKRRGSVEQSQAQPLKKNQAIQPNQYKQMINKLFSRRGLYSKGDAGSDYSSSSDGEDSPTLPTLNTTPVTHTVGTLEHKSQGLNSILRRSKRKGPGRHARLSPLVLLLDGALVGELDTVQRAVQEMSNPSQPNDEGITALHNAICGGHYTVVDFLVRIGANVSAPDSHGWTPLHCAASCNDKALCEYLVRNGAAVMAVTESDWATAAQKCDPYAPGYEECENFLRGVEEVMGVENSGVLYALWGYSAQAPDELSFREGDMVTILQKPEAVDWWWASLRGREGFVPNNYFGLFPKVRPKTLC